MEPSSLEDLQAATDEMKRLVDRLLGGFDQQAADLPGVCERLATSQSSAWSADHLAEVTVDVYGIVLQVRLADNAFAGGKPERLAASIQEAAIAAARAAHERRGEILTPIAEAAEGLPDLPDLFPGMTSLQEIRGIVTAATRTQHTAAVESDHRPE